MIEGNANFPARQRNTFSLTDSDFRYISDFAKLNFGLCLEESKKSLVNSRIARRLRDMGIKTFKEYREILESKESKIEKTNLLSVLTTNITSFFRERHHFDYLVDCALPEILKNKDSREINIWSAGCSTGQEPYSIALNLLRKMPLLSQGKLRIFASDIDQKVVEVAKIGQYASMEMSEEDKNRYKDFISMGINGDTLTISDGVKKLIEFSIVNLNEDFKKNEKFDVIFCRNVTIYFDRTTQQAVWSRFSASLKPNGYLFVGHSERVSGDASVVLAPVATTTYQKSSGTTGSGAIRLKARP